MASTSRPSDNRGRDKPTAEGMASGSSKILLTDSESDDLQNKDKNLHIIKPKTIHVASGESGPSHQNNTKNSLDKSDSLEDLDEDYWSKKAWEVINSCEKSNSKADLSRFETAPSFWWKQKAWDDAVNASSSPTTSFYEDINIANSDSDSLNNQRILSAQSSSSKSTPSTKRARKKLVREGLPKDQKSISKKTPKKRQSNAKIDKDESTDNPSVFVFAGRPCSIKRDKQTKIINERRGAMRYLLPARKKRVSRRQKILEWNRRKAPMIVSQRFYRPTLVHLFLELMYYCCLSPFNYNEVPLAQQRLQKKILYWTRKILFGIIATLGTWKAVNDLKFYILEFVKTNEHADIFVIVFNLSLGAMLFYYIVFVTFRQNEISQSLKEWEMSGPIIIDDSEENHTHTRRQSYKKLAILCGLGTIPAILRTLLYAGFDEWSLNDMLLQYGADFQYAWETWKPGNNINVTEFSMDFQEKSAPSSFFLGILNILMNLCNELLVDAARNLIIVVAMVNDEQVRRFGREAEKCLLPMLPFLSNKIRDLKCWILYRKAKEVNETTNKTFDITLKISHFNNILILTFIMLSGLKRNETFFEVTFFSYQMCKAIFAYYVARNTVKHNETTRKWIKTLPQSQQFIVGTEPLSRTVMLLELKEELLGLGTGKFLIDDVFIFTIATTATSILVLLLTL